MQPLPTFLTPWVREARDWGSEVIIVHCPQYLGKLLLMKAGTSGGLQFHQKKHETFYVLSGLYEFTYDLGDGQLFTVKMGQGQAVMIPPYTVHKGRAITDTTLVEFSTPHFDDRVRVEGRYGLPGEEKGLPTKVIS